MQFNQRGFLFSCPSFFSPAFALVFWLVFPANTAHAIHTNRFHFHSLNISCSFSFLFIHWLPFFSRRIHLTMMSYVCEADETRRRRRSWKKISTKKLNNQRLHNLLSLSHVLVTHSRRISDHLLSEWIACNMDTGLISLFMRIRHTMYASPVQSSRADSTRLDRLVSCGHIPMKQIKRINI